MSGSHSRPRHAATRHHRPAPSMLAPVERISLLPNPFLDFLWSSSRPMLHPRTPASTAGPSAPFPPSTVSFIDYMYLISPLFKFLFAGQRLSEHASTPALGGLVSAICECVTVCRACLWKYIQVSHPFNVHSFHYVHQV